MFSILCFPHLPDIYPQYYLEPMCLMSQTLVSMFQSEGGLRD